MAGGRDPFDLEVLAALPKLRGAAWLITRDRDRAENLVQDALLKAYANRGKYAEEGNMAAWLCMIARNHWMSEKRKGWRTTELSDELIAVLSVPADAHHKLEFKELLKIMEYMPPEQAEAVLMIAEGLSYEEAAEETNAEAGTVKSRVARGRELLRRAFDV